MIDVFAKMFEMHYTTFDVIAKMIEMHYTKNSINKS